MTATDPLIGAAHDPNPRVRALLEQIRQLLENEKVTAVFLGEYQKEILERTSEAEKLKDALASCAAGPWHYSPERPEVEGMYNIAAWDPAIDPDCLGLLYWQGTRWGFSKDDTEERCEPYAWAGPIREPRGAEAKEEP